MRELGVYLANTSLTLPLAGVPLCVNVASFRQKAQSSVESVSSLIQLSVQQAVQPAVQLADWINHTPNITVLLTQFDDRVPDWYARATPVAASAMINMHPAG